MKGGPNNTSYGAPLSAHRSNRSGADNAAGQSNLKDTPTLSPRHISFQGLGKGRDYKGLDRVGGIPGLPNVQLCILASRQLASTALENCEECSTDNQTTKHDNDNHGDDLHLQIEFNQNLRHRTDDRGSNSSFAQDCKSGTIHEVGDLMSKESFVNLGSVHAFTWHTEYRVPQRELKVKKTKASTN